MRKVFTLLSAILITAFSSMSLSAQNCGPATRTVVDCKYGTLDAVGWAMQQFFNDGSTTTWNFESGATFVENSDGTACLKGTITQYGSIPARSFTVVVNFTGKSTTTTGKPETNNLCPLVSTASWQYYTLSSGSLTGVAGTAIAGAQLTLSQHMMPSQYGIGGANQCTEVTYLGLTGWFEYQIVSQPSNGWLSINPYPTYPVFGQADICIRLSGTPTNCGGGNPPVANPDVTTTPLNTPVTIASLNNDNLNGGTNAQLMVVANPLNGSVQVINGQFVYTPNNGFSGQDVFTYKIVASNGTSNTTTVTITVTPPQQNPPVANPDVATTPQNTPVTIASLTNDNLNGGTNAQLMLVTNPLKGSVQIVNGKFVYTPNYGFSGQDVFTYKIVASNGTSNTTTVTVTVTAPVCLQPATPYGYTFIGQYGNNFYYKYNGEDEKYSESKKRCEGYGGHLAYCKEGGEGDFLKNYRYGKKMWLGLEYDGYNWYCGDGSKENYYNWGYGEPRKDDKDKKYCKKDDDGKWYACKDEEKGGAILVLPCATTPPPPTCIQPNTPYGYTLIGQYGNNFYYYYNGQDEKYSESKKRGEGYGGHLAYCKEGGEGDFLKKYKYGKKIWLGVEYDGYNWYCGDGSKENFYNWGDYEPKKDDKYKMYCKKDDDGKWYACRDDEKGGAILVLPCVGTPPPVCNQPTVPYGYTYLGQYGKNFYFKYNGDDEKYSDSKKRCEGYGGHLAYCGESGEGDFLKKFYYGKKVWIGIEYDGNNWYCNNGVQNNYYNWSYGEPKKDDKDKKYCKIDYDGKWYASKDDEKGGAILVLPCSGTYRQYLSNNRVLSITVAAEPNRTRIEWVNNTGITNDFFQIEKLNSSTGDFETLDNVKSLRTSVMEHYVSYDSKPAVGDNFYRINSIALDGSSHFSDIQKVNFKGLAGNLSLFPNPADEVLNIDLTSYKGAAVSLFVYNHLGQPVITKQIENVTDGLIQVDVSNQQVGNYLVRVVSKGKRDQTKSFILNK